MPAGLDIFTDSQSAIKAVESFQEALNPRRRLRTDGHPYLHIITSNVTKRVNIQHVCAHTDGMDRSTVGNRLADYQAKRLCYMKISPTPALQLSAGFEWLLPYDEQHNLILGDIRKTAQKRLDKLLWQDWASLSSSQILRYMTSAKKLCQRCPNIT